MPRFEIKDVVLDIPDELLNAHLTKKMSEGSYESSEARAARMRVKRGHRVLELGGGVGYISSVCAQITDPSNILTVEANPATLPIIRNNLDLNGAQTTKIVHAAVAGDAAEGESVLFRAGKAFWGSSIADATSNPKELVEVPLISVFELLNLHRPDVVIMDVEGAEKYLFEQKWPRYVWHVIMELHPRLYSSAVVKKIFDRMSQSGLTYDPGPSRGALVAFRRVKA